MPERKLNKSFTARVTRVIDGDTLEIKLPTGRKRIIRLAHIDAPERTQPYATSAKVNLERLCLNAAPFFHAFKQDIFGRWVATVALAGHDLARAQLAGGYAWHFTRYAASEQPPADFADYAALHAENVAGARGLFGLVEPIAPARWRDGERPTTP